MFILRLAGKPPRRSRPVSSNVRPHGIDMRALRFVVATLVGFLLYQFAVVYIGGFLAAVAIPVAYFQFFGREHAGVAQALLGVVLHVVPTVLLIAGGILAAERVWPTRGSALSLPYFVGMVSCVVAWELAVRFPCLPEEPGTCSAQPFAHLLAIPWWAVPVVASPWLGLGLASWLLSRARRTPRSVA